MENPSGKAFEVTANLSIEGILIADSQGKIGYVNPAFVQLSGFSKEELLGQRLTILDDSPEVDPPVGDIAVTGHVWNGRCINKRKDGSSYEVIASLSPLLDSQKNLTGYVCVERDVTQDMKLEMQLHQARRLESIGQLAAGIAHEINTPTQYVGDNIGFLKDSFDKLINLIREVDSKIRTNQGISISPELLQEYQNLSQEADLDFLMDEIPQAITESLEGIERVTKIVRAMKEFSHPKNQEKELANLNKAIETTITVARNEWKYVADMETDLDDQLPPVPCFPGDINQVILNLIINAANAIEESRNRDTDPKGSIRVSTRKMENSVEIRIQDSGTGIPDAIQSKIFDPFFTTKEVGKGTGQGLAIAHSVIVEKHQGSITFETECNKGTTFIINLPLAS